MSTHSRLSPSSSGSWTECTAQPGFVEDNAHRLPPDRGSSYADEGTLAHKYAEDVLLGMLGIDEVPDPFRPFIRTYVDSCTQLITPNSQVFVERVVRLFYKPEDTGTTDFICVSDHALHIRDLKYGAGQPVSSEYNKQLAIYAYSALIDLEMLYDFPPDFPVTIHAIQPRHHEWVDVPWVTTVGELKTFCEAEITPKAVAILRNGEVVFSPSPDTCRWCAAKGICEARAAWLRELPSSINPLEHCEDLDAPEVGGLTDEQLLSIFKHAKLITSFIDDVGKHLRQMLLSGAPFPGLKLVEGRAGDRKWVDEELTNVALQKSGLGDFDDRYDTVIKSPAKVEKIMKDKGIDAKIIEPLVTRSKGQPALALESDKRPAITNPLEGVTNLDDE